MAAIALDKATREALARRIARQLKEQFDVELAPFDAVLLLDVLSDTLGPHYYNQGLYDAQAVLKDRADAIGEAILGLERAVRG